MEQPIKLKKATRIWLGICKKNSDDSQIVQTRSEKKSNNISNSAKNKSNGPKTWKDNFRNKSSEKDKGGEVRLKQISYLKQNDRSIDQISLKISLRRSRLNSFMKSTRLDDRYLLFSLSAKSFRIL